METPKTLMNKDYPVLELTYDDELHAFTKIRKVLDLDHAPPGILNHKGIPDRRIVNEWWSGRVIPTSRKYFKKDFPYLPDTRVLAEKNMGLSLTDRYWIADAPASQKWADINFFDNPFSDDLGEITLGRRSLSHDDTADLFSPCSTLGGDLRKKWIIWGNTRVLLKSGAGPFLQEPWNEVIATALHKRIMEDGSFVPYTMHDGCSACQCMLGADEELVPMWDLVKNHKKPNHMDDWTFCLELCDGHGIPKETARKHLERMFLADFVLAGSDRHYGNFGLIRNVETLQYTRMAPVYDSGRCLWCDKPWLERSEDYEYRAKPFGPDGMDPKDQLELLSYTRLDAIELDGFAEEARTILAKNPIMPVKRLDAVIKGVERNIRYLKNH